MQYLLALLIGVANLGSPPAHADLVEHTVIDAVVLVTPLEAPHQCLELAPGTVSVAVALRGDADMPVTFTLSGYRDPAQTRESAQSRIIMTPVSRTEASFERRIDGGLYCYDVANEARLPEGATRADVANRTQLVGLRLVHSAAR